MNNEIKKEQFDRNNRKHNMKELSEIIYEEKTKNMSTQEKLDYEKELKNQVEQLCNIKYNYVEEESKKHR